MTVGSGASFSGGSCQGFFPDKHIVTHDDENEKDSTLNRLAANLNPFSEQKMQ